MLYLINYKKDLLNSYNDKEHMERVFFIVLPNKRIYQNDNSRCKVKEIYSENKSLLVHKIFKENYKYEFI